MKWIKVKDELPEEGKYVLCVYKNYVPFIGYSVKDSKYFKNIDDIEGDYLCSHWMSLPESPL